MTFERETLDGVVYVTSEMQTTLIPTLIRDGEVVASRPETKRHFTEHPADVIERHALANAAAEADPKLAQTSPRRAVAAVAKDDEATREVLAMPDGASRLRGEAGNPRIPSTVAAANASRNPSIRVEDLGRSSGLGRKLRVHLPEAATEYLADIERLTVEAGKRVEAERREYAKTTAGQMDAALRELVKLSYRNGEISRDAATLIDTAVRLAVEVAVEEATKAKKK